MPSAPKSFGSQLQLNKIPVLGFVAEQSGSGTPSGAVNGQVWYDTATGRLRGYEGGVAVNLSQVGSEITSNKGVANGYAGLDASGDVPLGQLPVASSGTSTALALVRADDSRLSDSRAPSGAAGGSLTGTFPNPTIANGAITDLMVAAANKDGVAGTASLRTLGTGAQQALAGNTRLDQITAPTAAVSLNSQRITNLASPTTASDAATKGYVDGLQQGLDIKESVRAASAANVSVTYTPTAGTSGRGQISAAPNTLDGVTLVNGNRLLLKDQTTGAQNGIWVVTTVGTGANGIWDRAVDFDADADVTAGAFTFVEEGTANGDSGWVLTTNNPIIIGGGSGTALVFTKFSSAASLVAGNGMTQTGNTFDVVGTANRITVAADSIDIASTYIGQTSITTVGTITSGTWTGTAIAIANGGTGATSAAAARTALGTVGKYSADLGALTAGSESVITHSLGTTDVQAMFRRTADGYDEMLSWRVISTTQIGVTADVAYASSALRVVVMG